MYFHIHWWRRVWRCAVCIANIMSQLPLREVEVELKDNKVCDPTDLQEERLFCHAVEAG